MSQIRQKPIVLAYYLPQFHPFKENDEWWGKGFTEWTNVGKAKPLFKGHVQPKVPTELGYYDLRLPQVREQQAQLAREAGLTGFCYWHYWFGKGKQLLNEIIDDVASSGNPDFPFCLGWANETWKAKQWNKDGIGDKVLIKQEYGGLSDYRAHYEYARQLFVNKNYVRIDGKPFFLIYNPYDFPDVGFFMELWNQWAVEDGIADGIYFVANIEPVNDIDRWISTGFNAVAMKHYPRAACDYLSQPPFLLRITEKLRRMRHVPKIFNMSILNEHVIEESDYREDVIPFLLPRWDHSPRSGENGHVISNSTPAMFAKQIEKVFGCVRKKNNKIVMLKSWNEWAEGNYMEPDVEFGRGFIEVLGKAVREF